MNVKIVIVIEILSFILVNCLWSTTLSNSQLLRASAEVPSVIWCVIFTYLYIGLKFQLVSIFGNSEGTSRHYTTYWVSSKIHINFWGCLGAQNLQSLVFLHKKREKRQYVSLILDMSSQQRQRQSWRCSVDIKKLNLGLHYERT